MRVCFISDTHEQHRKLDIPRCDVLVHCGDHSFRHYNAPPEAELPNLNDYGLWCRMLLDKGRIQHAVTIAGNHDWAFQKIPGQACAALGNDVTYLEDSAVEIKGFKFYGSPWTPRFCDWAFQIDNGDHARKIYDRVPVDVDILITHGPAHGWRDLNQSNENCGDLILNEFIRNTWKPVIHACGHVHGGHGISYDQFAKVIRVNASSCNEHYKPMNEPILIEIR